MSKANSSTRKPSAVVPASPTSTSRASKVTATLQAYVDGLSKKAEAITAAAAAKRANQSTGSKQPAGPLLTPLTNTSGGASGKLSARGSTTSNANAPEEKSASGSPARSKTASRVASRVPSASKRTTTDSSPVTRSPAIGPISSNYSNNYGGLGPGVGQHITSDDLLAPDANDHLMSPRNRKAGNPTRDDDAAASSSIMPPVPLQPWSLQRSLTAATEAVIAKHGISAPTPSVTSSQPDPNEVFASQSKDQQRTSMRPWYLNIQEKSATSSTVRNHRRSRVMQEKMSRTRNWGRQVREIVDMNEQQFSKRGRAEMDELVQLNTDLVKRQEMNELRLESIAGVFDLTLRAKLKKQRQMDFVANDHPSLKRIEDEKHTMFEEMWNRSHVRRLRVKDEFCTSWEILNFFGTKLHEQAQTMIQSSTKYSAQNLARLRAQIPGHISKQHAMQISLQTIGKKPTDSPSTSSPKPQPSVFANTPGIGIAAGAAAAPLTSAPSDSTVEEPLSDFRFPPFGAGEVENLISLRLPTSIAYQRGTSGIDHLTGQFNPSLARNTNSSSSSSNTKSSSTIVDGKLSDRNYTNNREHLALIHNNMTMIHTAPPTINPSWITLCCESGPKLLPRSYDQLTSSPGYTLIYQELLFELDSLQHRSHVVDLLEQAFKNYKQVVQINPELALKNAMAGLSAFYGGSGNRTSPPAAQQQHKKLVPPPLKLNSSSITSPDQSVVPLEDDPNDPLVQHRVLQQRLQNLCLELDICGFGSDLAPFHSHSHASALSPSLSPAASSDIPPTFIEDDSLPSLKSLAKILLPRFADRSKYYSKYYMEIHPNSQKNSWFAGFILPPSTIPSTATNSSQKDYSSLSLDRNFSVLDVDFYSTTQIILALHNDGSTFVSGHSRRVLQPLHDATVIGFVIDLLHGSIYFTQDGQNPQIIFGLGASMYTPLEQKQHALWIISQKLRPCFGLLGPKIKLSHVNKQLMKDSSERERARLAMGLDAAGNPIQVGPNFNALLEKNKPQRARHALTAHSSLNTDGASEAAGTIFAREASQTEVPPELTTEETAAAQAATIASNSLSPTSSSNAQSLHQQHNDGLIGWVVPKLSINLGEFEFLYLPQGLNLGLNKDQSPPLLSPTSAWHAKQVAEQQSARSRTTNFNFGLGACLAINTHEAPTHDVGLENDNSLLHAFKAYQLMKQTKLQQQSSQQLARDKVLASLTGNASATNNDTKAILSPPTPSPGGPIQSMDEAISDYKHRQSTAALAAIDDLRQQFLSRPNAADLKKQIQDQKTVFFKSLTSTRLVSWSHFPPQSVRVQQAVLKVQRIARRYIGFRARRALWNKLSKYASIIQRCYRRHRLRKNSRFLLALTPIQALWRGYKARKLIAILKKYTLTYAQANRAAVRIQAFIRMVLARKKVFVLAMVVQQKIEQIKGLVIFVQRMFRRRIQKRTVMANKTMLSAVLTFQSRIRGIRLRRLLAQVDPNAARQLKVIATNSTLKQRRYAAVCLIQRVWRGYLGRKFVRVKRNVIERDCHRLRDCWRAYQLRQRIDRAFRGYEADYLKAFFQALGYVGQEIQPIVPTRAMTIKGKPGEV